MASCANLPTLSSRLAFYSVGPSLSFWLCSFYFVFIHIFSFWQSFSLDDSITLAYRVCFSFVPVTEFTGVAIVGFKYKATYPLVDWICVIDFGGDFCCFHLISPVRVRVYLESIIARFYKFVKGQFDKSQIEVCYNVCLV